MPGKRTLMQRTEKIKIAKIIDGKAEIQALNRLASVSNINNHIYRTGPIFSQSNSGKPGRLRWVHNFSSKQIADKWLRMS